MPPDRVAVELFRSHGQDPGLLVVVEQPVEVPIGGDERQKLIRRDLGFASADELARLIELSLAQRHHGSELIGFGVAGSEDDVAVCCDPRLGIASQPQQIGGQPGGVSCRRGIQSRGTLPMAQRLLPATFELEKAGRVAGQPRVGWVGLQSP